MKYFFLITSIIFVLQISASQINVDEFPYIKPISVEKSKLSQVSHFVKKNEEIAKDEEIQEDEVPNAKDDDKDGISNKEDKCPNTSQDFMVDKSGCPQTVILKVKFSSSKANISPQTLNKVEEFAKFLQENKTYEAIIYGYTDNLNKTGNNKKLSRDRAKAVMNALIDYGVKLTRLTAIGMGSKNPIADNNTPEGRAINRRIEVELLQ